MFASHYDNDVTVFSPQGRLYQMEYAMQAAAQGSTAVGVRGPKHSVIVALQRPTSGLSHPPGKIIPLDASLGVAVSGITMDTSKLAQHLRTECLAHRFRQNSSPNVGRLLWDLGHVMQTCTQRYDRRPFGVALLVASYDEYARKPRLHHVCASSTTYECRAYAIGKRARFARDCLERHPVSADAEMWGPEALLGLALEALRATLCNNSELQSGSLAAGIVGEEQPFRLLTKEELVSLLGEPEPDKPDSPAGDDPDRSDQEKGDTSNCGHDASSPSGSFEMEFTNNPNKSPGVTKHHEDMMDAIARMMQKYQDDECKRKSKCQKDLKRKFIGESSSSTVTECSENVVDTFEVPTFEGIRHCDDSSLRADENASFVPVQTLHQQPGLSAFDECSASVAEISTSLRDVRLNIEERVANLSQIESSSTSQTNDKLSINKLLLGATSLQEETPSCSGTTPNTPIAGAFGIMRGKKFTIVVDETSAKIMQEQQSQILETAAKGTDESTDDKIHTHTEDQKT